MNQCPVCQGELTEDLKTNEKWKCESCGRVIVTISKPNQGWNS